MNRAKPYLLSLASGFGWAVIASMATYSITGSMSSRVADAINGAVIAGPLIGILIGSLSRRFVSFGVVRRSAIALLNLYVAAYFFLWAAGLDPFTGLVLGLTFTGWVVVLWPLSYANHLLISRAWQPPVQTESGASAS